MKQQLLQVEAVAECLDEAVENALAQLHCTRAEADVEVLQVHSSGLFGMFGRRPARVRIKLHDRGAIARQITQKLLQLCALDAEVEWSAAVDLIELNLAGGEEPSRLVGRHGQVLDSLQTLVETMTDRLTEDRTPILIDVDGYRDRRRVFLHRLAGRMVRKARQSGKAVTTPPLTLTERRILHGLFKQEVGLESRSGNHEGGRKRVTLQPRT